MLLPELDDFKPAGDVRAAARARARLGRDRATPRPASPARRDTNTMPQWAGSCWYYLRFCDPHNDASALVAARPSATGCPSTSTSAAPSTRCCTCSTRASGTRCSTTSASCTRQEPFQKLLNQGMILGVQLPLLRRQPLRRPRRAGRAATPASAVRARGRAPRRGRDGRRAEGALAAPRSRCAAATTARPSTRTIPTSSLEEVIEKMSKSRGNVVNPDDVIAQYGADAMRLYELFMGPAREGRALVDRGHPRLLPLPAAHLAAVRRRGRRPASRRPRSRPATARPSRRASPRAPIAGRDRGRRGARASTPRSRS